MTDSGTLISMGAVALFIGSAFVFLAWFAARNRLKPETSRKAAHIAVGLCAVSFGWLFDDTAPVAVLCAGGLAFAMAVRYVLALHRTFGSIVHGVSRRSYGDACIPIAVPIVHGSAMPEREFYVIPILVLTLADAAAALVGKRHGRWAYRTDEGTKTLEGSAALAIVTAIVVFGCLQFWGYEWARGASISVLVAILVMLAEAVSWRGLDNLILPLGTLALLRIYTDMPEAMIRWRVVFAVCLLILAVVWHRKAGLIGAAGIASVFTVYACWAIGGIAWSMPPLLILLALPFLGARHIEARSEDLGVGVVFSMASVPLGWLFLHDSVLIESTFLPFLASWFGVLGLVWIIRRNRDRSLGQCDGMLTSKILVVAILITAVSWEFTDFSSNPLRSILILVASFCVASLCESLAGLGQRGTRGDVRWALRATMVLITSCFGLLSSVTLGGEV